MSNAGRKVPALGLGKRHCSRRACSNSGFTVPRSKGRVRGGDHRWSDKWGTSHYIASCLNGQLESGWVHILFLAQPWRYEVVTVDASVVVLQPGS